MAEEACMPKGGAYAKRRRLRQWRLAYPRGMYMRALNEGRLQGGAHGRGVVAECHVIGLGCIRTHPSLGTCTTARTGARMALGGGYV
jgi:hypothetical protein